MGCFHDQQGNFFFIKVSREHVSKKLRFLCTFTSKNTYLTGGLAVPEVFLVIENHKTYLHPDVLYTPHLWLRAQTLRFSGYKNKYLKV